MVSQRRRRRCELLQEIRRLRGVMTELEGEVDSTVRSIAAMDQFVRHLSQISFLPPSEDNAVSELSARPTSSSSDVRLLPPSSSSAAASAPSSATPTMPVPVSVSIDSAASAKTNGAPIVNTKRAQSYADHAVDNNSKRSSTS
ncbi:hypothetical protein ATCC90586_000447 [Pythium insidiosum]|nr:hypothetical protein ATCC90586_000447 [Pythium insidiosum]